jgi:hypothetical protein
VKPEPTREERGAILKKMIEDEQALMRDIYGFDNGVVWERERIIKKLLTIMAEPNFRWDLWLTTEDDLRLFLNQEGNTDNSIIRTTADNVITDTENK